ncbi:hypothetical protein GCM10027275_34810 [Rhabdobacter roseus]
MENATEMAPMYYLAQARYRVEGVVHPPIIHTKRNDKIDLENYNT